MKSKAMQRARYRAKRGRRLREHWARRRVELQMQMRALEKLRPMQYSAWVGRPELEPVQSLSSQ